MTRIILISGCSSGIGRCAALGMQARGWSVFATARKPQDIAALQAEGLHALYLDYAEEASITAATETVLSATGGRLDALFNNGAYAQPGALEDVSTSVLRAQFEANFFGWHALTRSVVPVMRRQGRGRVIMSRQSSKLIALGFRGFIRAPNSPSRPIQTRFGSSSPTPASMSPSSSPGRSAHG